MASKWARLRGFSSSNCGRPSCGSLNSTCGSKGREHTATSNHQYRIDRKRELPRRQLRTRSERHGVQLQDAASQVHESLARRRSSKIFGSSLEEARTVAPSREDFLGSHGRSQQVRPSVVKPVIRIPAKLLTLRSITHRNPVFCYISYSETTSTCSANFTAVESSQLWADQWGAWLVGTCWPDLIHHRLQERDDGARRLPEQYRLARVLVAGFTLPVLVLVVVVLVWAGAF